MAKGYRYMGHTADVEFLAYGSTLEISFKNALMALFETIAYTKKVSKSESKTQSFALKVKAKSEEELLWYVLQDAISMMGAESLFAYKVMKLKIRKIGKRYALTAKVLAKSRTDRDSKLEIKGVSMYDLKIEKKKGRFTSRVVVDV